MKYEKGIQKNEINKNNIRFKNLMIYEFSINKAGKIKLL